MICLTSTLIYSTTLLFQNSLLICLSGKQWCCSDCIHWFHVSSTPVQKFYLLRISRSSKYVRSFAFGIGWKIVTSRSTSPASYCQLNHYCYERARSRKFTKGVGCRNQSKPTGRLRWRRTCCFEFGSLGYACSAWRLPCGSSAQINRGKRQANFIRVAEQPHAGRGKRFNQNYRMSLKNWQGQKSVREKLEQSRGQSPSNRSMKSVLLVVASGL